MKGGCMEATNKLIAEFMGLKPQSERDLRYFNCPDSFYLYDNDHYKITNTCSPDTMEYHSNWNWLMPVVQKIYETGLSGGITYGLREALYTGDIDNVYPEVISILEYLDKKQK
jgi:hypothetical protein